MITILNVHNTRGGEYTEPYNSYVKEINKVYYNRIKKAILTLNDGSIVNIFGIGNISSGDVSTYSTKTISMIITKNCTSISSYTFSGFTNLSSVTIEDGIETIENHAFTSCSKLISINIPNTITSIPTRCFYYCSSLPYIHIPKNITSIGGYAFSICTKLKKVKWDAPFTPQAMTNDIYFDYITEFDSDVYNVIDGVLYNGGSLFAVPRSYNKNNGIFELPSFVTSITSSALRQCSGVKKLIINNECVNIGQSNIYEGQITSVTIPSGITVIPNRTIYFCNYLSEIYIYCEQAPTCTAQYSMCRLGEKVSGEKILHVPINASGYSGGKWDLLINSGWQIVYDL